MCLGDVGVGAGEQQSPARPVREAGPHLLPVDHPVVAVAHRGGGQAGQVGAGARLGEQLAPDVLGGGQRPQPGPLDVVGLGVFADGRRGHAVAHRVQAQRHRTAGTLQDAVGDGLVAARDAESAKAFGEVHPGQARVVTGAEELGDGDRLRVVIGDDRSRRGRRPDRHQQRCSSGHDRKSTPVNRHRGCRSVCRTHV